MSTKSKSITNKNDFYKDERLKKIEQQYDLITTHEDKNEE